MSLAYDNSIPVWGELYDVLHPFYMPPSSTSNEQNGTISIWDARPVSYNTILLIPGRETSAGAQTSIIQLNTSWVGTSCLGIIAPLYITSLQTNYTLTLKQGSTTILSTTLKKGAKRPFILIHIDYMTETPIITQIL